MGVDYFHFIKNMNNDIVIKIKHFSHVFFDSVLSCCFYNLPHSHTLDIWISGPYEQISDELQGYFSELLDSRTLDIEISGRYEQISDELQGYFSELLDSHTLDIEISGLYERLYDELEGYL